MAFILPALVTVRFGADCAAVLYRFGCCAVLRLRRTLLLNPAVCVTVQLDGEKTVVLFDPLYSRYAYIDYHNKCVYCSTGFTVALQPQ